MIPTEVVIARGTSVSFTTSFFDVNGAPINPSAASVSINYADQTGNRIEVILPMTAPSSGNFVWIALWDTRGFGPGQVLWSIHSAGPPPCSVEDGQFILTANAANLPTFS